MIDDIRFSIRSLLHARGFAMAAVLTLALGIGATTVVYSVVDGLLLRPLPFGAVGDRLVTIHSVHPTQTSGQLDDADVSYADLMDFRDATHSLDGLEGVLLRNVSLSSEADSDRVAAASVMPGLFAMLQVAPALGRHFREDEAAPAGLEQVAIISDGLWTRWFAQDPTILGRRIMMNGRAISVIGVMPPRFDFPDGQQLWLPYRADRDAERDRRGLMAVGVLKEGATIAQARAELDLAAGALASRFPQTNRDWAAHVAPVRDYFVASGTRLALGSMLAAVGLVLLVACGNIAGLLVARGVGRQRELTVRAALGAGRGALVRLLMCETALLSAAGGALGLLGAVWGLAALLASNPEPPPAWALPAIDGRVLAFVAAISVAAAFASGWLPAWRASRVNAAGSLNARTTGQTADQRRLQTMLVAGQIAVSFVLILGAALLTRSIGRLQAADVGFDPAPLASLRFYIAGDAYDDPARRAQAVSSVINRLSGLAGVRSAAAAGSIPADDGGAIVRVVLDGSPAADAGFGATLIPVTPAFWRTLGLTFVEGGAFQDADALSPSASTIVISWRLAQRLWPGESAIGRSVEIAQPARRATYRVVGVSPDVVYEEIGEESEQSRLAVYVPYAQAGYRTMAALLRVEGDPARVLAAAREAVREVDPSFVAFDLHTMEARRRLTQWGERFTGRTFGIFAVIGLLLACVGSYGLTAYAVAQRRREIGIRIAMGATPGGILRLLLGRGARLALVGTMAGAPLAFMASRAMREMLYDTSPSDPLLWAMAPAALLAAVLLASYIPARRASGSDPAEALRAE